MRRAMLALLCVSLVPSAAHADQPIQPGAQIQFGGNLCTMNFIFTGGGKTYVGTAGHCTRVNQRARSSSGEFGTVRFQRDNEDLDFALVEVDAAQTGQVDPTVRGFGAVHGASEPSETRTLDEVFVHGYGVGVGSFAQTRSRSGVMMQDNTEWYTANMPAVNGDSGGPVVHVPTGKALGIVSVYGFTYGHPATDRGPTVAHILATLRAEGFAVSLA